MKKVYILASEYTNGKEEVNGVFRTEDGAKMMQKFLIKEHLIGELGYRRGIITQTEVEDEVKTIFINGQEFAIA